jgi:hypothetical protein
VRRTTILLLVTLILAVPAGASNRMLTTEFEVDAPIEKAWTIPAGGNAHEAWLQR